MRPHPQFPGLPVLDDEELAERLGARVAGRRLVHEWPLTRTEEVRMADGRHLAVKTQLPPSVEAAFYAAARSPLLVASDDLGPAGAARVICTAWITAPDLGSTALSDAEYIAVAERTAREIGAIGGTPPVQLDLATEQGWAVAAGDTATRLRSLVAHGRFRAVTPGAIDGFERWAATDEVSTAAMTDAGIVHGDLTTAEVFPTRDGTRVIDWQRPLRGPWQLDFVALLRARGVKPEEHVEPVFARLAAFPLLYWAALTSTEVLPDQAPELPEGWALTALSTVLRP